MPTPEDYEAAWDQMKQGAWDLCLTAAIESEHPPPEPDSDEFHFVDAGIAMGIAAATSFYKGNPHMIPEDTP